MREEEAGFNFPGRTSCLWRASVNNGRTGTSANGRTSPNASRRVPCFIARSAPGPSYVQPLSRAMIALPQHEHWMASPFIHCCRRCSYPAPT